MIIPHSRPTINEDEINRVAANLRSGLIAYGNEVRNFEKNVGDYVHVLGGVATNCGTSALHLSLLALGIGPNDSIVLPSYVCASVLHAVNYTGATPLLADIEPEGYNIWPESVAEKVAPNTKAVIVPHMFGTPANLNELLKINIPIVEDCAQAIGSEYSGGKVGSFGILSIFSFKATKLMTTGQGGMVLTNSPDLLGKLQDLTRYDEREGYHISYNYEMTDFQAAMGQSQLDKYDSFMKRRQEIENRYDEVFYKMGMKRKKYDDVVCFRYIVEVDDASRFVKAMKKLGINCAKPVFKPLHRYLDIHSGFPNTERAMNRAISIPIYPSLQDNELDLICQSVKTVWTEENQDK